MARLVISFADFSTYTNGVRRERWTGFHEPRMLDSSDALAYGPGHSRRQRPASVAAPRALSLPLPMRPLPLALQPYVERDPTSTVGSQSLLCRLGSLQPPKRMEARARCAMARVKLMALHENILPVYILDSAPRTFFFPRSPSSSLSAPLRFWPSCSSRWPFFILLPGDAALSPSVSDPPLFPFCPTPSFTGLSPFLLRTLHAKRPPASRISRGLGKASIC